MRSLVCWDVSTVCALLVRATSADNSAVEMRHDTHAPSLAGCIRIDNPSNDYTAVKLMSMRHFVGMTELRPSRGPLGVCGNVAAANWFTINNKKDFPGLLSLDVSTD